jgi:hypothetical protein
VVLPRAMNVLTVQNTNGIILTYMGENLKAIGVFVLKLAELDKGKGLNRNQYPVLDTEYIDPETWWDILTEDQKIDVGGIAIHFKKMSANYRWDCYDTKFCDLKKSQK